MPLISLMLILRCLYSGGGCLKFSDLAGLCSLGEKHLDVSTLWNLTGERVFIALIYNAT